VCTIATLIESQPIETGTMACHILSPYQPHYDGDEHCKVTCQLIKTGWWVLDLLYVFLLSVL